MIDRAAPILSLILALSLAGCANQPPAPDLAQTPILWGAAAGGLQIGIAAQLPAAPPDQPQPLNPPLQGVKIYLRNTGSTPLTIVDPAAATPPSANRQPPLVLVFDTPGDSPALAFNHPDPGRLITLIPSQMTWFSVDTSAITTTRTPSSLILSAGYVNNDPVITIAPPNGARPARQVQGVWTGQIRSGNLQLKLNP